MSQKFTDKDAIVLADSVNNTRSSLRRLPNQDRRSQIEYNRTLSRIRRLILTVRRTDRFFFGERFLRLEHRIGATWFSPAAYVAGNRHRSYHRACQLVLVENDKMVGRALKQ